MGTHRAAAGLLVASGVVAFLAQILAMSAFTPVAYSLSTHLISDLGATQCGPVSDAFGTRYVCSGGYMWFNVGTVISGVLLALAGVAWRRQSAVPLVVAAVAVMVVGAVPFDRNELLHDAAAVVHLLAYWAAMAMVVRRDRPTALFLAFSVVGFVLFLLLPVAPGVWERLAFDTLIVWTLYLGVLFLPRRRDPERDAEKDARDAAVRKAARELG